MGEEVIKILDHLGSQFGLAIDWTSDNVLPYLSELSNKYINWRISSDIFYLILSVAMILISILSWIVLNKKYDGYSDWEDFMRVLIAIVCFCVIGIFFIVLLVNCYDIIKCCTCPEIAIAGYIKAYLNNN